MKTLFITLAIVYCVIALLAFIIQALFSLGDSDQSSTPWGMVFMQSIRWPFILIKLIGGIL